MDDELEFGEGEAGLSNLIELDNAPSSLTFAAYDQEGRCAETCDLDIEGSVEDVLANLHDLQSFLKKHKKNHTFTVSGDQ